MVKKSYATQRNSTNFIKALLLNNNQNTVSLDIQILKLFQSVNFYGIALNCNSGCYWVHINYHRII